MPGLGPGIHAFLTSKNKDVDGRDKPGHDGAIHHTCKYLARTDGSAASSPEEPVHTT